MNFRFYVLLTDAFTEKREWTDARALFARPGVPNPKPPTRALWVGCGPVPPLECRATPDS